MVPRVAEHRSTRPGVLIVDDDESLLAALRRQLHRAYNVTTCTNGEQALDALRRGPYAAIVSDMRMAGLDGAQVLGKARELSPNTTRILLTGHVALEATITAINEGQIFRMLAKPCSTEDLQACLREAIARHEQLIRNDTSAPATARDRHVAGADIVPTEGALRAGMRNGEFRLHYQPVIDLHTGTAVGVEALVRWLHPEQGLLPPGRFIAMAEQSGLITDLGRWVLSAACEEIASWPLAANIGINVSRFQLHQPSFVTDVTQALSISGLEPRRLLLEVNEPTANACGEALHAIGQIGVRIALDDVATPPTSLGGRADVPINVIKIDRPLVSALPSSQAARDLGAEIVRFAHDRGIAICAEGIETITEHDACRDLGCATAQGFLYAEPLQPAAALAALAANDFFPHSRSTVAAV
jgi:EAL domain-containing protein (putative c-di-GMP-specific phosphodiesterase class I)/ActR/RegA family two-component response regulator